VAASLRNSDGTLLSSNEGQSLPIVDDQFVTGDPRVMENPELTAVTTLFMREHNYWVRTLASAHPTWTGDQLYQMARAITTAEYENIVYKEYLPVLIGPVLGPYRGYSPHIDAEILQEFSTAAFRVGHSQISDEQEGIDNAGNTVFSESLAQAFFNTPEDDEANGFNPLLRNLGGDFSQATDVYATSVLRNLLFADLPGGGADEIDLIAIDIRREYDVGLGTLNQTRKALGLPRYTSFAQLTSDPTLRQDFEALYGTIDNVDLFMGGLAEHHAPRAVVGPTFQAIIALQFYALRTGDRFFWENQRFDRQTAVMISNTTLGKIITRNTDSTNIQAQVFYAFVPHHHVRHHVRVSRIDTRGHKGRLFLDDGK
jgi:Animal haem peroxidase